MNRSFHGWMFLAAALVVSNAALAESGYAIVRSFKGIATAQIPGGRDEPVAKGLRLPAGSVIHTSNGALVDLFLMQNGPIIRLFEGTELGLQVLNYEPKGGYTELQTQLDLRKGRIKGVVRVLKGASKYEIHTPNGVASVRRGEYDIRASGEVHVTDHAVSTKGGFSGFRPRQ